MNCMRSLPALSIFWALCCCRLPLAAQAPCDPAQVWEKLIAAKGGREKLESVRAFFVKEQGAWRMQGLARRRTDLRVLYALPGRAWQWYDSGMSMFGVTVSWGDREQGIGASLKVASGFRPVFRKGPMPEERYPDDRIASYFIETKWTKPKALGCAFAMEEKGAVIAVDADTEGYKYRYYLDAKTYLPMRLERQEGRGMWVHNLEDYQFVDGIMLPGRRREVYVGLPPQNFTVHYEINPAYDPDLWKRDPSVEAGPDAWRLKKR